MIAKIRQTWQIILLTCGILIGTGIQTIGYDFAFPYIQEFDEGRLFWNAYALRVGKTDLADLPYYPPALYRLHDIVQPVIEAQTRRPAEFDMWRTVGILRLMAIVANALTALLLALTIRHIVGWGAGMLGALSFLLMPMIISQTTLALTEAWQALGYTSAMYFAFVAYAKKSPAWALMSILAGLLTIAFKYSNVPALGFGMGVILVHLWRERQRRWWLTFATAWLMILLGAVALIILSDALAIFNADNPSPEGSQFLSSTLINPAMLDIVVNAAGIQIATTLGVIVALSLACLITLAWQGRWHNLIWLVIIHLVLWGSLIIVSRFIVYIEGLYRYVTPTSPLVIALLLISGATLLGALRQSWANVWFYRLVILVIGAWWLFAPVRQTWAFVQERQLPYTTGQLSAWAFTMIRDDAIILIDRAIAHARQGQRIFERDRGGWQGDWKAWQGRNLDEMPLEYWRSAGFAYYMDNSDKYADEDILLLRHFLPETGRRTGAPLYFYRLWRMQTERDDMLGDVIRFVGYDWHADDSLTAGGSLAFTPYWQAITTPAANYNVYLHLTPLDSRDVLAQADGAPVHLDRPTITWDAPHETLIGATFTLQLPADLPAGNYRLLMGLYDYQTGARLTTPSGDDFITVQTISIETD